MAFALFAGMLQMGATAVAGPATTGSLDATFGTQGIVRAPPVSTAEPTGFGVARALAVLPDGRIVAAGGSSPDAASSSLRIARFNADGSLDPSFGAGSGVVGGLPGIAKAVLVTGDGRILVAGTHGTIVETGIFLARFNADGTPDATFGGTGFVLTSFGGSLDQADALAVDGAGRIVVAGTWGNSFGTIRLAAVARHHPDGSRDNSFGQSGVVRNGFGSAFASARALAIDALGRIVMGGDSLPEGFAVARYLGDGTPDASFGGTGSVTVPSGGGPSGSVDFGGMVLDGFGRIVLAGGSLDTVRPVRLARLNADGTRDAGFGTNGVATDDAGQRIRGLAIDASGRIVVTGWVTALPDTDAIVARYLGNGARDASFASGGVTRFGHPLASEAHAVVSDAAGRPVWAGAYESRFALGRVMADGGIDSAFGSGGVALAAATTTVPRSIGGWRSLVLTGDGKIVTAGPTSDYRYLAIARHNADGTPDATFGGTGTVAHSVEGFSMDGAVLAVDATGRVVVAGTRWWPDSGPAVIRFNADGSPDTTFGGTGTVVIDTASLGYPRALAIASDGRIVLGGGVDDQFALVRLNADGSLDGSFGNAGVSVATPSGAMGPVGALAFDAAGRIVAASMRGYLARFNAVGSLDTTFGTGGSVAWPSGAAASYVDMAIDAAGRIVAVAGLFYNQSLTTLLRVLADGTPDAAFGDAGSVTAPGIGAATAMGLDPAGRIVVAGRTSSTVVLSRFGPDGTSDAGFGGADGIATTLYSMVSYPSDLAIQPNGRILLTGVDNQTFGPAIGRFHAEAAPGTADLFVSAGPAGTGSVASSPAGIDCGATCDASFPAGATVTLVATPATGHVFSGWSGACAGTGQCQLAMDASKAVAATFAGDPANPRLGNLSTRGQVLAGDNVIIGGFIIGGSTPKTVLVRARGPSLTAAGVAGAMANPRLTLVDQAAFAVIATNDDWGSSMNVTVIAATGNAPTNALESAILISLNPGAYTAIVDGVGGGTGVGIVEVFEVDHPGIPLVNISTRGLVLTGDSVMIGGFIVNGNAPKTVLIRARGPSLASAGVSGVLGNPRLTLVNQATFTVIASNDDFGTATNLTAIQATGNAPTNALESAILITLNPGAYTAIVDGVGGATGVGIVEVFAQ